METGVATVIDAVVAIGVERHFELFVGLVQCVGVTYHIAQVHVVVGSAVYEQQLAVQLVGIHNSRAVVISLLVLFG